MIRLFTALYNFFEHRRTLLKVLLLVLILLCGFGATRVSLKEDISGFLPSSSETGAIRFITSNLKGQDKIIIHLSAKGEGELNKEYAIEATEYLVDLLQGDAAAYIDSVFYYVDEMQMLRVADFIASNAPYFMEEQDYIRLDSLLAEDKIEDKIARQKELLSSPIGGAMESVLLKDPLSMTGRVTAALARLQTNSQYATYDSYLFSKDFSRQIIILTPRWRTTETAQNSGMQAAIEQAIKSTAEQFDEIDIRYFGAPIIAAANASQIKRDSILSLSLSLLLILALMFYVLRSVKKMMLVALPVVFGALFAIAAIWLIQGTISAIAIGAGSIIFGIAISYSIHFVLHATHCRSVHDLISEIAQPMTVGSLSTVGAFLSLLFIRAEAMRDFGLFAALSLIGAILFVLVFLPHVVGVQRGTHEPKFKWLSSYKFEKNRWVTLALALLTTLFLYFTPRTTFDTDLQKINYMSAQQRADMHAIVQPNSGERTLCVAAVADKMETALVAHYKGLPIIDSLVENGAIRSANNFGQFVPTADEQRIKIERWNSFWNKWNRAELRAKMEGAALKQGFKPEAFDDFFGTLDATYTVREMNFYSELPFVNDYVVESETDKGIATFITLAAEEAEGVIEAIERVEGLVVFDKDSISRSMVELLVADFNFVLYICGCIVFVLLWLSFGRIEIALVAFIPMVVSWIWILGIMAIFGISFNVINIILATFIFGLGDDFSIFITDGTMHEYAYGSKITDSHKSAVILSALTMLFGIGTLIFAKHPAMLSLAHVTLIGMFSVVVMAYVLPPLLFNGLVYKKGKPRLTPITVEKIAKSICSFTLFLMGSLYLTVAGFILLTIGKRSQKNKLKYHTLLCKVSRLSVRHLPMVKGTTLNKYGETFEKPSVIIANHQSHLDLIYLLALSPKVIILTNRWVWHSPFYGLIIRYADFYPVANGIENSVEKLRPLVEQGYSIVVFPEGTRSLDEQIHRFHKGAFYLASKLGIDILPIVTHGIGGALPKQEFLMRHSTVTVSIMERQRWHDMPLNQQAKEARQRMVAEQEAIRSRTDTCDNLYHKVLDNYLYKGAEVERKARRLLREHHNYKELVAQLPEQGTLLIRNCGIGVASLMAALVRKGLTIYATDIDPKMVLLASRCSSIPVNLHYVTAAEAEKMTFDKAVQL